MGGMFLFSGVIKLQTIGEFYDVIYKIGFISYNISMLTGNIIIFIELFIGAALVLGVYIKSFLRIALLLIISFSLYLLAVIAFGLEVKGCGCFGRLSSNSDPYLDLARDILILLILTILLKSDMRCDPISIDGYAKKHKI